MSEKLASIMNAAELSVQKVQNLMITTFKRNKIGGIQCIHTFEDTEVTHLLS